MAEKILTTRSGKECVRRRELLEAGGNVVSNDDAVRTFGLPLVPLADQLRRAA